MRHVAIGIIAGTFLLCGVVVTAYAQPATPVVTKRQVRQQQRIGQGVASGQITAGEAARLEREQAHIARDKAVAKADGVVTPRERRHIKREQNKASRDIARAKHNLRTQPGVPPAAPPPPAP